jgi:predicted O-methyltransferase YrrM
MSTTMSLETALLAAALHVNQGDLAGAGRLLDQILAAVPRQAQAAIIRLWIAGRAGDPAALAEALRRLAEAEGIWATVPLLPNGEGPPALLDAPLRALFGGAEPPVSDISDHLGELYFEAVAAAPRLIVELGTRGGESTRALLAAALRSGARMLSVDIDPCDIPDLAPEARRLWTFVRSDDVAYGRGPFEAWCRERGLAAEIDVLFIDTSHLYEHTREELATWAPKVAPRGTMIFHDTHMDHVYLRKDGAISPGWNNARGVIRAIEEMLGVPLDETRYLAGTARGWAFRHVPRSSGFTVLRRIPTTTDNLP